MRDDMERKNKKENIMLENEIKLVALDMDGTLLDSEKNPPEDFEDWVRSHTEIQTVLASGRQYQTLRNMFPSLEENLLYVSDNGGFVFRNGEMVYNDAMLRENILWCIDTFDGREGLHLILCGAKAGYMRPSPGEAEENARIYYDSLEIVDSLYDYVDKDCIAKVAIFVENGGGEKLYQSMPELPEGVSAVLSGESWVDFANDTTSKGSAMEAIQKKLDIQREESMAFGDYLNDCELLLSCAESYAMENAHPELKKYAKYQTASNDDDGVMKVLRTL